MRSPSESPEAPPLTGRITYLVGGVLPTRYLEWVRNDLTGPGWRHRQAMRPVLLMIPFALAFAVLPGTASVRVSIPLALLLCALVMGYTTGDSFRNRRLRQYGIPQPKPADFDEPAEPEGHGTPADQGTHADRGTHAEEEDEDR